MYEESTYELEQSRVLVDHLRIWDRQIRVRKAHLCVGGIGSVLTHLDLLGRGYARALLRDAETYMAQSGYDLGMLFTIIGTSFYAKLDWVPIPLPTFVLDLINYAVDTNALEVREACFAPGNSRACNELAPILLAKARQKGLQTIKGSLPLGHPLSNDSAN